MSGCAFGSIGVLAVVAQRHGAPLLSILSWRYAAGALLLALLGGGGQAALAVASLSSLKWITAAALGFLFYTYPAWVTLFAAVRGTERLTTRRLVALLLSLGGIALIIGGPGSERMPWQGVALALGSAVWYALFIPLIARLQQGLSPAIAASYVATGAGVLLALAGALTKSLTVNLDPSAWAIILLLGFVSTALAFIAFLRGLAVLGPVRTAIISTVEPFWTAILGALLLGQMLRGSAWIGGALIAAAVLTLQGQEAGQRSDS